MASRGWYAEKMRKLKQAKVAEMKERNAISAIDHDNEQLDWWRNPALRTASEAPKGWKSLGQSETEKRGVYKYTPAERAMIANMLNNGYNPEDFGYVLG